VTAIEPRLVDDVVARLLQASRRSAHGPSPA
jgi:hypothetical protein